MKNFKNKVAVITGGASGFGREFANIGAKLGMKIVLADVQKDALNQANTELEEQGAQVLAVHCDVRKADEVQALADATIKRYGEVHLLFNNAGVGCGGLVWEHSLEDWEWVLGVNLWGVVHGIRTFMPLMLECSKKSNDYEGHIVNTASIAGLLNGPTLGAYNVSKHAIVSLSESLYQDLKLIDAPISTSVLCPFFSPTGISQSHRNRPNELMHNMELTVSQRMSQAMIDKAVRDGTVTAKQVAELTFDAICEDRFYIFSHKNMLDAVKTRMEDIVEQRNPSVYEPESRIRKLLQEKLKLHPK